MYNDLSKRARDRVHANTKFIDIPSTHKHHYDYKSANVLRNALAVAQAMSPSGPHTLTVIVVFE